MPTIYRESGFRYFFYSNEGNEPSHVHIEGKGGEMKIWLEPFGIEFAYGLSPRDQRVIVDAVSKNMKLFKEKWDGFTAQKSK